MISPTPYPCRLSPALFTLAGFVGILALLPVGGAAHAQTEHGRPANLARPSPRGRSRPRPAIAEQTYNFVTLASLVGTNSDCPLAGLITDGNGNFYGTTVFGGANDNGTIFEYSASAGIQTLASFNGVIPLGLVTDGNGNFYGTTVTTLFEYSASGGLQTLNDLGTQGSGGFNGEIEPPNPITIDGDGNVYGAVSGAGANGDGYLFEYNQTEGFQTLASFDGTNGIGPNSIMVGADGNLYGTTASGGAYYPTISAGAIYEYSASGGLQALASFTFSNGTNPVGIVPDGNGGFYGASHGWGGAYGWIFGWSASGGIKTLAQFTGDEGNGSGPMGPVVGDGEGDLFGVAMLNGSDSSTVYEWSASGGIQTLAVLNGANGLYFNNMALLIDGNGNIYGTNNGYGASDGGSIFELVANPQVSGTISMVGCVNPAQTLTFTFRPAVGNPFSRNVTLASDGSYSVGGLQDGTYTIAVKGPSWLQTDVGNVVVGDGAVTGMSATLLPGDINGDNVVDIQDFSLLAAAYGSNSSSSNWNPNADLNCDGVVNIEDFALLAADYGLSGDP
jgi:uncharacterized repeat protein (TIGR03803 family)